ncbi:nuclear transport factor 2 family protein [Flavobacterium sp. ARAG 55.4]|uniref:Nuclear transport factor 2 family protein n=1 Tax=Flavobacterium plantiphilum TaxID=3163297 RepID=A0ABW8XN85_9FLAO
MISSEKTIHQLYTSIAQGNLSAIDRCYSAAVKFHDPVFGKLTANKVPKMWKMLIQKSYEKPDIEYKIIKINEHTAEVKWKAVYIFGKKKRKIINNIHSVFHFKDGLIIKQNDDFNIWKWTRQAFGLSGFLFGWTGYMQRKIQMKAQSSLSTFNETSFKINS